MLTYILATSTSYNSRKKKNDFTIIILILNNLSQKIYATKKQKNNPHKNSQQTARS